MSIHTIVRSAWHELRMTIRYALNLPYPLHAKLLQSPKKPRKTFVFIHGIGNTLHAWDEVCADMPKDVRIIGIDLLGFGQSPKPYKAVYDARLQARSVARTLLKYPSIQRPVLVGHSLGALVAVELSRRYPLLFSEVVLCSPPLYGSEAALRGSVSRDQILKKLYRTVRHYPDQLERIAPLMKQLGMTNESFSLTRETMGAYIASLESSIINQSALYDIPRLKIPVTICYGTLDPLVVGRNISSLSNTMPSVVVYKILAGHEVVGGYAKKVARILTAIK